MGVHPLCTFACGSSINIMLSVTWQRTSRLISGHGSHKTSWMDLDRYDKHGVF